MRKDIRDTLRCAGCLGTTRAGSSLGAGNRGGGGSLRWVWQGWARPGSHDPSHLQPGGGQLGSAAAPGISHLPGDTAVWRLGRAVGPRVGSGAGLAATWLLWSFCVGLVPRQPDPQKGGTFSGPCEEAGGASWNQMNKREALALQKLREMVTSASFSTLPAPISTKSVMFTHHPFSSYCPLW